MKDLSLASSEFKIKGMQVPLEPENSASLKRLSRSSGGRRKSGAAGIEGIKCSKKS